MWYGVRIEKARVVAVMARIMAMCDDSERKPGCGWPEDSLTVVATDGVEASERCSISECGRCATRSDFYDVLFFHLFIWDFIVAFTAILIAMHLALWSKHAYKLGPYIRPRRNQPHAS